LGKYIGFNDAADCPAISLLLTHEIEGGRFRFNLGIEDVSGVEVIVVRDPLYRDTNDLAIQIILIEHTICDIDNLEIIAGRIKSLIPNAEIKVLPSDLKNGGRS
jgi:hypothetical protein